MEKYGLAVLLGIPGTGKSTTARYIAVKMRERGYIPIILSSQGTLKSKVITEIFKDERGKEHLLFSIPVKNYKFKGDEVDALVKSIANIVNTVDEEISTSRNLNKLIKSLAKRLRVKIDDLMEVISEHPNLERYLESTVTLADLMSSVIINISVISIAFSILKALLRDNEVKFEKETLVIIDDVAELTFVEGGLKTFVDELRKRGAKVLLIKRIDLVDEFLKFSEDIERGKSIYVNETLFGGVYKRVVKEEQVFIVTSPDVETFVKMLRANGIPEEKARELYEPSGGLPSLAIMLHEVGVEPRSAKDIDYHPLEEVMINKSKDRARETLAYILASTQTLYREIAEKDRYGLGVIALVTQPYGAAYDELKRFCKDARIEELMFDSAYKCHPKLDNLKGVVEVKYEELGGKKRKYYLLKDNWRHLIPLVEALSKRFDEVAEEVKIMREVLLDITTEDTKRYGEFTDRTVMNAIENVEWLSKKGTPRLKEALMWGAIALRHFPFLGSRAISFISELWKNSMEKDDEALLYASICAHDLASASISLVTSGEPLNSLVMLIEELTKESVRDEVALCHISAAYSRLAKTLATLNRIEDSEMYLNRAKNVTIKTKELKEISTFYYLINKAEVMLIRNEDPLDELKEAKELLSEIERMKDSEALKRFIKRFFDSVAPGEIDRQIKGWKAALYSQLGKYYFNNKSFEMAKRAFIEAWKNESYVRDILMYKSRLGKIAVIGNYKFEWEARGEKLTFERVWKEVKENLIEIPPKNIAIHCAEYLASQMVKQRLERIEEECMKYLRLYRDAYFLTLGLGAIFGMTNKRETIVNLKEYDLHGFDAKNPYFPEMKERLETFYDSILGLTDMRYEAAKKLEVSGIPIWLLTSHSKQALARVMVLYLINDLEGMRQLAERESKRHSPLLNELFSELAKAVGKASGGEKEAEEEMKRAFVKLFYYHI